MNSALLRNLDHLVWNQIKENSLQEKKILVALSGGVDSLALLRVLSKVHASQKIEVAYVHHGLSGNTYYRDRAHEFCLKICQDLGLNYKLLRGESLSNSENDLRALRYELLRAQAKSTGCSYIAFGHHAGDLLETRLMRLIRGSGLNGLVAMKNLELDLFRPFLETSKTELQEYLYDEKLAAFEDPSNIDSEPLRNWIRNEWLPQLDDKVPGSTKSLARSLNSIVNDSAELLRERSVAEEQYLNPQGVSRSYYLTLNENEKSRVLARYLYLVGKKDFSQSHLQEIKKRLANSQNVITFKIGGCDWEINAEQIKVLNDKVQS